VRAFAVKEPTVDLDDRVYEGLTHVRPGVRGPDPYESGRRAEDTAESFGKNPATAFGP